MLIAIGYAVVVDDSTDPSATRDAKMVGTTLYALRSKAEERAARYVARHGNREQANVRMAYVEVDDA